MKNKIAALLIAFSILPVNLIFANNEVSDFSRNIDMLDAFGILEKTGDEQADAYVTRGEFAGLLYNTMQLNEYDKTKFTDVYEEHLASVAALENYNIVHGHGDEFRPDDIITNTDAVVMIMRALGYSTVAEYAGGYPNGYLTFANDEGITDDIDALISDYANMQSISQMLCNMLEASIYVTSLESGSASYEQGEAFMGEYHDVYRTTGVLQYVDGVSIKRSNELKGDNIVILEYEDYFTNLDLSDYLGYKLDVYYKDIDGDKEIIYVEVHKSNTVYEISGYDIDLIDKDKYVIEYYNNEKTKKINFYNGTEIVLNGEYINDIDNTDLSVKDGILKAIDNNGDKKADILIITRYDYLIAERISVNEEFIIDKITGKKIYVDTEEIEIIKNDEEISFDTKLTGNLLEIVTDGDGAIKKIFVYEALSGKSNGFSNEEININGENIKTTFFYKENVGKSLKTGVEITYYTNADGRIVWAESEASQGLKYGYLINTYLDEGGESGTIKLLNSAGDIEKINLYKKLRINDTVSIEDGNLKKLPEFQNDTVGIARQPIMYSLNEQGEINKIYTAKDTVEEAIASGADSDYVKTYGDVDAIMKNLDEFSLDYSATSSIRHVKGRFNSTYAIGSSTVIFNVPQPTRTDVNDKDFYLGKTSQFYNDKKYSNLFFYDCDESMTAAVLVNYRAATESIGESYILVDKVSQVYDEADAGIKPCLSGYLNGKYVEYIGDDMDYVSKESTYGTLYNKDYSNIGWSDLKCGDIIRYSLNKDNEINAYRLCAHDITNLNADYMLGGYSNFTVIDGRDTYGAAQFCTAEVSDIADGCFYVKTKTTTGITVVRRMPNGGYVYTLEDGKLLQSTVNDLYVGDRVVVACGYDVPVVTVIVRE